ncbi:NAD(P)H-dependent oxidoreductase [Microterricola viridarii]|uniref:Predicted homoserine dehydrogenase, contains C-terminal SAF domain n=1 Tax=Microterricola viridarii TaxID=412690 RepID=A0A1H1ZNL7_9MICO|nr:SAF domain-containing protein [Microterricola viridarii]SDT35012.1 Predicted homoserine dehydrogenase, contains C-terminal SAF domain [Microterricola viridarii]
MNLHSLLARRAEASGPIRVGVIGAGKFASMYFTQIVNQPEIHLVAVAELDPQRAFAALERTGWARERYDEISIEEAVKQGRTAVVDSATLLDSPHVEIVLEITGHPIAGVNHALAAIDSGKHIIMVNVEADSLVGPILKERADKAGVVYSMAYGDQPALICEMVDWCRTVGYDVISAGKGTKYLPEYRYSTPDTVWDYYGFTDEQLAGGDFNPKMFNSFLDGTKSAIEMAAVANATGLTPPTGGLLFPPVDVDDLSARMIPRSAGGLLAQPGMVEVISSLDRDGSEIARDLRWGVFVTFEARTDYARDCFAEYGVRTDPSGRYGSLYRPYHMIGMELNVSVASAVLRNEATGAPNSFSGDVVSVAKRDLAPGETLDGEGGFCVTGTLEPAATSLAVGALPMGLASGVKVTRAVAQGQTVTWADVEAPAPSAALELRRELERRHATTA